MNNQHPPDFSIVIPVFDSTTTLNILVKEITNVFAKLRKTYELIFVDDGSIEPKTWPILLRLHRENKCIKLIQLWYSHGQHKAVLAGLLYAKGAYAVTMDDDLQHPPKDIKILIRAIEKTNADVVIGIPATRYGIHSVVQNIGSFLFHRIDGIIFQKPKGIRRGSFRIIKRDLYEELPIIANNNPVLGSLIFTMTRSIVNVEITPRKRNKGSSGYNFFELVNLALDSILNYSTLPLRIIAVIGIFYFLFSIAVSVWIIYEQRIESWRSLTFIQLSSVGFIMAGIAIIGEYLMRVIKNVSSQPLKIMIRRKYL
ncbi:MAG: glycosyltransferase [bacterium]|nr:glycosyltransferase [bacterium]